MRRPNHHKNAMLTLWTIFRWICIGLGCAASAIGLVILAGMAFEALGVLWGWVVAGIVIIAFFYWAAYDESVNQELRRKQEVKARLKDKKD